MAAVLTVPPPLPWFDDVEPAERFRAGEEICPGLLALEHLGDGCWSECWLAWSVSLWCDVVVKLPLPEMLDDPRAARRLGHEARMLRQLSHPAIQRLLEDGHRRTLPHLVFEYGGGPDLAKLVERSGAQPPADVVSVGAQLASCLHYLHGRGAVHLDLKPGNVVLGGGRATLIDFDTAMPAGSPALDGRPTGSLAYMAPEQCQGAPASPRMDLFALGAVLYELATGRPPFPVDGVEEDEFPQLLGAPPPLLAVDPSLPPSLDTAVRALTDPDPDRRPRTALEAFALLTS
jgi:serine/threonine protein kinase